MVNLGKKGISENVYIMVSIQIILLSLFKVIVLSSMYGALNLCSLQALQLGREGDAGAITSEKEKNYTIIIVLGWIG